MRHDFSFDFAADDLAESLTDNSEDGLSYLDLSATVTVEMAEAEPDVGISSEYPSDWDAEWVLDGVTYTDTAAVAAAVKLFWGDDVGQSAEEIAAVLDRLVQDEVEEQDFDA